MKRTAIVHIGLEKTGSTAVQHWLATNQPSLSDAGIVMPRRIGFPNHTKLVAACLDDGVLDNIKSYHLYASGHTETRFRAMVFSDLRRDVLAAGAGWHTLLVTSELISSRLSSRTEISRLHEQILQYVDRIHFVIFLRRQDRLALSRFSSLLRSGHGEFDAVCSDYSPSHFLRLPDQRPIGDAIFFYDFEAILERFDGLPHSSLMVFPYDTRSPIDVFSQILGIESTAGPGWRERHNQSMCAEAQFILAQLNKMRPVQFASGMRNEAYRRLQLRVEAEISGPPRTMTRQSARDFLARYSDVNQRISRRFGFAGVFSPTDFDDYPEVVDYSTLPDSVAIPLARYQAMAQSLPAAEPLVERVKSKLRGAKASVIWLLRRRQG